MKHFQFVNKKVPLQKQRYIEIDSELISSRTVSALRKQSGGLFLAMTAAAGLRGLLSMKIKKVPLQKQRYFEIDSELISLRTVSALRKQSGGLVLAMTAAAGLRGLLSMKKKYPCKSKGTLKSIVNLSL